MGATDSRQEIESAGRRRPATVQALDARLSVWGQAARDAVDRRAEAIIEGATLYAERVGRNGEVLRPVPLDHAMALLCTDDGVLELVAANLIPRAIKSSSRLLWVDPEKLQAQLRQRLSEPVEAARAEIRRQQALYRRRARLWSADSDRLDRLRDEVESLRVPRLRDRAAARIARSLLERHRADADLELAPATEPARRVKLRLRAGSITRWIDQLDKNLRAAP